MQTVPRKPPRLLVVGYGRFGAALVDLARAAGVGAGAVDTRREVPPEHCATLEDAGGAEFVVMAVPVPALGEALAELRPHLGPSTIVLDVGSVKVHPTDSLRAAFGEAQPWVPTHPLFGPASLARGERPLRVVVCGADTPHTSAAAATVALFEQLGCVVVDIDAHTHDRKMAWTHALAFFVARGIVELGVDVDEPLAPPSFQAMATTVRTVREDAGHLFDVLQLENPYAAEMRRAYREALGEIDAELDRRG
jgi:prephenate dehydrogenase